MYCVFSYYVHAFNLTTTNLLLLSLLFSLFCVKQQCNYNIKYDNNTKQYNTIYSTNNTKQNKGSLFELTGGTPKLGFGITAAITAIGLPVAVFLIYAAILKGAAETEEADKEFMNEPRGRL